MDREQRKKTRNIFNVQLFATLCYTKQNAIWMKNK